jgi:hypothetical protein
MGEATIDELVLADTPAAWAALGFAVSAGECQIGSVRLRFAGRPPTGADQGPPGGGTQPQSGSQLATNRQPASSGLIGWTLRGIDSAELDGLPTSLSERPVREPALVHPNGVLAIDHVVAVSPAFERSVAALQAAGLDLRRVREQPTPAGAPRQAFFRLGREILELVAEPDAVIASSPEGERDGGGVGGLDSPSRFWGLALVVEDIERTAELLASHVGEVRDAVQPGRRIATVRRSAGLSVPLALMSAKHQEVHA